MWLKLTLVYRGEPTDRKILVNMRFARSVEEVPAQYTYISYGEGEDTVRVAESLETIEAMISARIMIP